MITPLKKKKNTQMINNGLQIIPTQKQILKVWGTFFFLKEGMRYLVASNKTNID